MIRRVFRFGKGLARFAVREVKERIDRRDQQPNAPAPANQTVHDLDVGGGGSGGIGTADYGGLKPPPTTDVHTVNARLGAAGGGDDPPFTLLDCREFHEWEAGYIDGCVHIPMNDLPDRVGELDPNAPTVVYCLHGMRSAEVATWLAHEKGFLDVTSMDGGIVAWYADYDQQRIVVTRSEDH